MQGTRFSGLDDSEKDDFYDCLINIVRTLGGEEIVDMTVDFNSHIGGNPENCEDQHGGYGYEVRKDEREKILEFCTAVNLIVENTLFKKRASHLSHL